MTKVSIIEVSPETDFQYNLVVPDGKGGTVEESHIGHKVRTVGMERLGNCGFLVANRDGSTRNISRYTFVTLV